MKNKGYVYVTGSVKGVAPEPTVKYTATKYYYIKIRKDDKTFYYGKGGALVDASSAVAFTKEEDALTIRKALSGYYSEATVFPTTKKLS